MTAIRQLHSVLAWGGSILLAASVGVLGPQALPATATEMETVAVEEVMEEEPEPIAAIEISATPIITRYSLDSVEIKSNSINATILVTDSDGIELCRVTNDTFVIDFETGEITLTNVGCSLEPSSRWGQKISVQQIEQGKGPSAAVNLFMTKPPHWRTSFTVDVRELSITGTGTVGTRVVVSDNGGKNLCETTIPTPESFLDTTPPKLTWSCTLTKRLPVGSEVTVQHNEGDAIVVKTIKVGAGTSLTQRFAGKNRYDTSAKLNAAFPNVGGPLFVVTGQGFADALSAAPAVKKMGGSMILTTKSSLPTEAASTIKSMKPSAVYLIGGTGVVSPTVEAQIMKLVPTSVRKAERISGANRYQTSEAIFVKFFAGDKTYQGTTAFIATGRAFPDALSASAVAGALNSPVLLVDGHGKSGLSNSLTTALTSQGIKTIVIAGGSSAVNTTIEGKLRSSFTTIRKSGANRYQTNGHINSYLLEQLQGKTPSNAKARPTIWVATGDNFPDALSAAPLAANSSDLLWLAPKNCLPNSMPKNNEEFFGNGSVYGMNIIGGTGVLSPQFDQGFNRCPS